MRAANALPILCLSLLLAGCAAKSLTDEFRPPGPAAADAGIIVGSFILEPAQEGDLKEHYWLQVSKLGLPAKQFSIPLHPGQEEDVIAELPAGTYFVRALYEGKPGPESQGYGAIGGVNLWFELHPQDMVYLGRLWIVGTLEPAHLTQERAEFQGRVMTSILSAAFGSQEQFIGSSRRKIYVALGLEDGFDEARELLRSEGWSEDAVSGMKRSLLTEEKPGG